jgi:hypothetical protein
MDFPRTTPGGSTHHGHTNATHQTRGQSPRNASQPGAPRARTTPNRARNRR